MFTNFILNALEGIIVGIISLPFIIVIHELGHLLCGKLSGYHFISLRLILFQWTKDKEGKVNFSKVSSLFGIGGQCLMIPTGDEKDFRYMMYNLGGGLANIFVGVILIVPIFFSGHIFMRWLFIAGIVSFFIALINLIPIAFGGIPNDGRNIMEVRKSEDARLSFHRALQANGQMALGKNLSDFDEDFFKVNEDADVNNFLVAQFILFHAAHLEAKGNYRESYQKLLLLEKAQLPAVYKAQVLLALLFDELVYQSGDEGLERAKERWALHKDDKRIHEIIEEKNPALMIPYAAKVAFIDLDYKAAIQLISEAEKLLPTLQNPGTEHLAGLMIQRLKERLPEDVLEESIEETIAQEKPIDSSEKVQEEISIISPVIQEKKPEIQEEKFEEVQEEKPEDVQAEEPEEIQTEKPEEIQTEEPEQKNITGLFESPREEAPATPPITPTVTPTIAPTITPTILFEDDREEKDEVSEEQKKKSYEDIMEQLKRRR